MNVLTLTALVLTTEEFKEDARNVGELITTTAPGHCGHSYATYRVDAVVRSERGTWRACCVRVVQGSVRNPDGTFSTGWREATKEDIQPGTGLLRDGVTL